MPERISLDKSEFEAFVAQNQALVETSEILLEKINSLQKLNRELEEELKRTKERLDSLEASLKANQLAADERLREARKTIARVMQKSEKLTDVGSSQSRT